MNCSKCGFGVMEDAGFITMSSTEVGGIELNFCETQTPGAEIIKICSLDECGHVETKVAPGTLTIAKRLKRRIVFEHYA